MKIFYLILCDYYKVIIFATVKIEEIEPVRDLVLIKLPPYTDKLERGMGELSINTLNQIKYHPTCGEVVKISDDLKYDGRSSFLPGTTVYFEKSHWQAAKDAAFDSESEVEKGIYFEQDVFAMHVEDTFYMMLPYRYLYMAKVNKIIKEKAVEYIEGNGKELWLEETNIMLNGYVLCEPVISNEIKVDLNGLPEKSFSPVEIINLLQLSGKFVIADTREETYALNQAKIVELPHATTWLQKGDTVFTLTHCDIPLVEGINNNNESQQFIIELENIIAKYTTNMEEYIAAPNRIVIELLETEKDESALQIDSEFSKMCRAKVVSVGEGVKCAVDDIIVIPRNAGKKNRLPLLDNKQYEVIGKDDYFVTVKESK